MVLSCVLEPGVVGFNMGDVEVIEKLPEQVWSDYYFFFTKKYVFIVFFLFCKVIWFFKTLQMKMRLKRKRLAVLA